MLLHIAFDITIHYYLLVIFAVYVACLDVPSYCRFSNVAILGDFLDGLGRVVFDFAWFHLVSFYGANVVIISGITKRGYKV